jgi:tetraacyldisaccharide-1-P 4'-kinase
MMKKQYLRILMAVVGLAGLGVTAKAQDLDQVVVTIPFEFVVGGKTLPAGTYRTNRISNDKHEGLILSSVENHVSVILHPTKVESTHDDNAQASFQEAGDQRILSAIGTGDNIFTIPVSSVAIQEASARSHTSTTSGLSSVSR